MQHLWHIKVVFNVIRALLICTLLAFAANATTPLKLTYTHNNIEFDQLLTYHTKQKQLAIDAIWAEQSELKKRLRRSRGIQSLVNIFPADHLGLVDYVNFSEIPTELISSDISEKALALGRIKHVSYGVPITRGNHLLLYYNKKYINQAASSWQLLREQVVPLPEGVRLISWNISEMYWFVPFLTAFDGQPTLKGQPNLNNRAMVQALEFVWQQVNDGLIDSRCNYHCAYHSFVSEQAAYFINGVWSYKQLKAELGDNLGVAVLPTIKGKPMRSYYSSLVLAFANNAYQSQPEYKTLIDLVQSESFQFDVWLKMGNLPSNKRVWQKIKQDKSLDAMAIVQALEQSIAMPSDEYMWPVWSAMEKGFNRFGGGQMRAEQAAKFMQSLAEKNIAHMAPAKQ
ncbi:extracellular solute-binding protein [Catenovulum sp. SM1970]|uniref:sugar ABC transporter substrate-binding protein n=1 Tax=Marinifaba aquimaris TaxID=2741323 RepID=UPI0015725DE7|nr:extracellular solute-binding protein [Marinifaba aquimaris]NTS78620.1 extracellular solute-binding protein [Marinifaba aquimaris]